MIIKAIKFREGGFATEPFAFGGEEGMDKFDRNKKYRSGLSNYLIDLGDEVILVDTGLPINQPEEVVNDNTIIYTGHNITDYMTAFKNLGYKPEQVTTILLTHRHNDHSGCLNYFPNAKVYVNEDEMNSSELHLDEFKNVNYVPVKFDDGPYYNFPETQTIRENIHFIKAKGHTNGNSIVIVEDKEEGLFYMIHGDITYVDEALYQNKLSIVFDDLKAARVTMDRIREFISKHPTVYLSTHTPEGPENLEAKRVVDLNKPTPIIPYKEEVMFKTKTGKYVCSVCGYVYDPKEHDGVTFEDLPDDWKCPRCKRGKDKFNEA